jgi:hypothetical protein
MKRLGKGLFGVLCIILLFTFSHAAKIHSVVPSKKVKIAWDATTTFVNGKKIKNPEAVGYFVYKSKDVVKECEENKPPPEKSNNIEKINKRKPITGTVYEIPSLSLEAGQYLVGVQAVLYKDENMNDGDQVVESTISWSCSETCTNNNPFCLRIGQ